MQIMDVWNFGASRPLTVAPKLKGHCHMLPRSHGSGSTVVEVTVASAAGERLINGKCEAAETSKVAIESVEPLSVAAKPEAECTLICSWRQVRCLQSEKQMKLYNLQEICRVV